MLHDNMNIFLLMVHAQQLEEERVKRKSRDVNRAKTFDSGSSKGGLDIQDEPRIKKRFSNKVPSNVPKASDDRVLSLRPKRERVETHLVKSLLVPSVVSFMWANS